MTVKSIPVEGVLEYLLINEQELKISAYVDTDGVQTEVVLMSGTHLYNYLMRHYYGYIFYYVGLWQATDSFLMAWHDFFRRHQNNINRQYTALTAEYNPISNYDMTEHEETEREDGGTVTTGTLGTKTQGGTVGDAGENTTTSKVYGYNSGAGADADKVEGTNGNTRTYDITNEDDTTVTETIDTTAGTTRDLTRSGNIGVTTSAQMVSGELELRVHDIAVNFIKIFAVENLHAIGIVGGDGQ